MTGTSGLEVMMTTVLIIIFTFIMLPSDLVFVRIVLSASVAVFVIIVVNAPFDDVLTLYYCFI